MPGRSDGLRISRQKICISPSQRLFIAIGILCAIAAMGGDRARELLQFEVLAVQSGEWWRIVTAFLVHTNPGHLLLNLAGLLICTLAFANQLSVRVWGWVFAFLTLWISGCYLLLMPIPVHYLGLSAWLYGIATLGGLLTLRTQPLFSVTLLLYLATRILLQHWQGVSPELTQLIGDRVATESHVFGWIGGHLATLAVWIQRRVAPLRMHGSMQQNPE